MNVYTLERLKDIITDHYNYEVTELAMCQVLFRYNDPKLANLFIDMNLEHTLLHARNLFEFYYRLKDRVR